MTEKNINSRIIHKHDIEANWIKATNFIPLAGELIIYDADEAYINPRVKIGDGVTLVNDLPFADESLIAKIEDLKTELSSQADWNQNDENALDYVKNRTHHIKDATKIILPEMTVEVEEIGANGQTYIDLANSLSPIYGDGRLYIVTIDGVSYRCNSWHYRGEPRIGDSRFLLESEPEYLWCPIDVPFLIDYYEEWGDWFPDEGGWGETTIYSGITLATTPGSHTIKIEEVTGSEYVPLDEKFIPDTIARTSKVEELTTAIANKKDKDLVVTYRNGSHYYVTHDCSELYAAFQNGQTIYFQKDLELLNLLEINNDYATFYMYYVTQEGKPRQQIVAISGDTIIMELDDEYDYATTAQLANKADKKHTHTISDVTNLQTELDARVSANRTINGKPLEADISLTADDVGADASGSAVAALTEAKSYTDTATNNLQQQIDNLIPVFIGTQEQYNAKESEIPVGALVIITDNEINLDDDDAVSAILGKGKLGYLILN